MNPAAPDPAALKNRSRAGRIRVLPWLMLAAILVAALLTFPRPQLRGTLVETEIQRCQVARPNLGVTLDVSLMRSKSIYQSRKFWNQGALYTSSWRDEQKRPTTYDAEYGGNYCDTYPAGRRDWSLILPDPPASGNTKLQSMPAEFVPYIEAWTRD